MVARRARQGLNLLHEVCQEPQTGVPQGWDAHKPLHRLAVHRARQAPARRRSRREAARLRTDLQHSSRPAGHLALAPLIRGNPVEEGGKGQLSLESTVGIQYPPRQPDSP